ncbi:MAG TPA: membrane protein insertase YidC [Flavisolibacter sp.]|jgi:YidC/Oxa1 family membrane protein insertase|nr:membrane protein insertase YidC [Flavisolibacter sp.]
MNFDRSTVIGFVVLALLFFGYFYFNNQQQAAYQKKKAQQDSIANIGKPKPTQAQQQQVPANAIDTQRLNAISGDFQAAASGSEQIAVVETDLIRVGFSNKGGQPKWVELKHFKAPDSSNVKLAASDFDRINYTIQPSQGATADITSFYFSGGQAVKNADGSTTVTYQLTGGTKSLTHQFIVRPNNYLIDFNLEVNGATQLFSNNTINVTWQNKAMQLQRDLSYERQQSQIGYREDGDYDYHSALSSNSDEFTKSVNWVAVKQQFFNSAFIAKNNFTSGRVDWTSPATADKKTVVQAIANLKLPVTGDHASIPLAMYYGPTDYKILKQYGNDMEEMVNLGSGMFAFVKYINRWIILPVFDLFAKLTSNFGIVILLLTLFIRLLISPLTYTSYLSGAKMKVLRPEIEQLKAKYGGDQQQISVEQMKLFREAGVNPLGGCIPGLLQIPIFFALYSFFNSNVALRGQSFLWAKDLSQYDSIINFGVDVPLLGNHLSLFTLTAITTSFLISIYSMSMTPDQNNPVLKYMPYFFPVILLFVFNKLPAGLTWYYTVSNIITLALQFIIQNYIINHEKILAKIEENRKKPKKASGWAEKMAQMQEQQKKMQEQQRKGRS